MIMEASWLSVERGCYLGRVVDREEAWLLLCESNSGAVHPPHTGM